MGEIYTFMITKNHLLNSKNSRLALSRRKQIPMDYQDRYLLYELLQNHDRGRRCGARLLLLSYYTDFPIDIFTTL